MVHYWPHSIDILKPEQAVIDGRRPIFLADQGNVHLLARLGYPRLSFAQANFENLLFGDDRGEPVEFSADQCVSSRSQHLIPC